MMRKPFKFRYVNELVGGFVLLAILLLVAGIIITGRGQGWFETVYEIRTIFPEEGSLGLRRGSEVRVLGVPAGMVTAITPREDGELEGVFRIRGRFYQYIRQDSIAVVKLTFGVAGEAYVEITRGRAGQLPETGAYIPVEPDTLILDTAEALLEEVREVTVPAIQQMQLTLEEFTGLAMDIRDPEGEAQRMLHTVNNILTGLERGEGLAGKLLRDQDMANDIEMMLLSVQETMDYVNEIMLHVAAASEELPRIAKRLRGEIDDIPGLMYQTQATLRETEVLLKGIQRHWLLRKYVDEGRRLDADMMAPSILIGAGEEYE